MHAYSGQLGGVRQPAAAAAVSTGDDTRPPTHTLPAAPAPPPTPRHLHLRHSPAAPPPPLHATSTPLPPPALAPPHSSPATPISATPLPPTATPPYTPPPPPPPSPAPAPPRRSPATNRGLLCIVSLLLCCSLQLVPSFSFASCLGAAYVSSSHPNFVFPFHLPVAWVQRMTAGLCHTRVSSFSLVCCLGAALQPSHVISFVFHPPVSHNPSRHRRSAARALAAAARRSVCLPAVVGGAAGLVPQQRTRRATPGGATLASRTMAALLGLATGGGWAQCCGCRRQPAGPAAPTLTPSFLLFHPSNTMLPASSHPCLLACKTSPIVPTAHLASPSLPFRPAHAAPSLPVFFCLPHAHPLAVARHSVHCPLTTHVSCVLCPLLAHI